jgi:hypothetical protein
MWLAVTNTLAYNEAVLITAEKCLIARSKIKGFCCWQNQLLCILRDWVIKIAALVKWRS